MPIDTIQRYTCPITGVVFETSTGQIPPGWVVLNGNWYGPLAVIVIAQRIVANPLQSFETLRSAASVDEVAAAAALVAAAQGQGLVADADTLRGLQAEPAT